MLYFKKADLDDMDLLVETRIKVLRTISNLDDDTDMSVVEKETVDYYKNSLLNDEHVAYLVYDDGQFAGCGGVCFYKVMPSYHNPSGRKAYIMNMYTHPEYRRQGIAFKTLDLLIQEARKRNITKISLDATKIGRKLYEKYGFVYLMDEMELL